MPAKKRSLELYKGLVFERILGRRQRGDMTYYKVQWKGQLLHTWEIGETLCPVMVAEFEQKTSPKTFKSTSVRSIGFNRGLEAERILGLYAVNDELMFKMKWKGSRANDFVTVNEAKLKCPLVVIAFYEQKIVWT